MLTINDFQPISLEDRSIFHDHYTRYPPLYSGNVFTTIISWMSYIQYSYTKIDDHLIIMQQKDGELQFRIPTGMFDKNLTEQVFLLARKEGSKKPIQFIEKPLKEILSTTYPQLKFVDDPEFFDYVYLTADLAELPGTKYAKIRNRLNQLKKNYNYITEKISSQNIDEIHEFLKRWCLWKNCGSDEILENERKAILYSMAHFTELDLSGIALRINSVIEAIAVFEKMNDDTVVVHFEKGSPDYDGIYKAVNMESAKLIQPLARFIDREEDLGLAGLRKAKMSYHPHHMIEVSHLTKENIII